MTISVSLSTSTRSSLYALNNISRQIARAQTNLSTGKRVNDPTDDPAAYFTASSLRSRAVSLGSLLDTMSAGQKTIDAASAGMKAIQSLLQSAQTLGNQALASTATLVKVTGTNSTALTTSSVIATTAGSATRLRAGDTITVSDGTTTATYTAANNDTVQTFLNAVNNTSNLTVTASLNSSGQLQLQASGATDVIIGGTVTPAGALRGATGLTAGTTTFTASSTRQSLAQQFDNLRTQIDQAVKDASYNGVNLLGGGTLSVVFNESGSSKLSVAGVNYSATSLGLPTATSGSGGQFQTDAEITAALSSITAAITTLQTQSSALGSNLSVMDARRSFMSSLATTLEAGADDLVNADTTAESALLTALQTRQQLAAVSLSISSQQDTVALRLFGLS